MESSVIAWVEMLLYAATLLLVGLLASRLHRGSLDGFFLAGRKMHWILVGLSLFTTNVGVRHFLLIPWAVSATGLAGASYELSVPLGFVVLAWVFTPVYQVAKVFTMPEYLERRLGGHRVKIYLSIMSMFLNAFVKIALELCAGAFFIKELTKGSHFLNMVIILIPIISTISGGFNAAIVTSAFPNTLVMLVGAIVLVHKSLSKIDGGIEEILCHFSDSMQNVSGPNAMCDDERAKYKLHLVHPATDKELPWPGTIFGFLITSCYTSIAGQVSAQHVLASRNVLHARAGAILASGLHLIYLGLLVLMGLLANFAHPGPATIMDLEDSALKGLMGVMLVAAQVTSLAAAFNANATIVTMDLWRHLPGQQCASNQLLMVVGRIVTSIQYGMCALLLVLVEYFEYTILFQRLMPSLTFYLAPPICAVYLLAVFWQGTNERGVFWTLMVGLVAAVVRLSWEFSNLPSCENHDSHPAIRDLHFLHFSIVLFAMSIFCCLVLSAISGLFTQHFMHVRPRRVNDRAKVNLVDLEGDFKSPAMSNSSVEMADLEITVIDINKESTSNDAVSIQAEYTSCEEVPCQTPSTKPSVTTKECVETNLAYLRLEESDLTELNDHPSASISQGGTPKDLSVDATTGIDVYPGENITGIFHTISSQHVHIEHYQVSPSLPHSGEAGISPPARVSINADVYGTQKAIPEGKPMMNNKAVQDTAVTTEVKAEVKAEVKTEMLIEDNSTETHPDCLANVLHWICGTEQPVVLFSDASGVTTAEQSDTITSTTNSCLSCHRLCIWSNLCHAAAALVIVVTVACWIYFR